MIGDGTWEDNWLFKKKRNTLQTSGAPGSIGMLVPAPKENVRAQIGDRTADEVSDLSEIGSDAEESSLDLLRCNDLNDRLLSKHLIGGQNTKLVLDELVDRTSLTSHTLPEEHEAAFTDATNTFVTQPTIKTVPEDQNIQSKPLAPPPPMSFQDNQENEDPAQQLIAGKLHIHLHLSHLIPKLIPYMLTNLIVSYKPRILISLGLLVPFDIAVVSPDHSRKVPEPQSQSICALF